MKREKQYRPVMTSPMASHLLIEKENITMGVKICIMIFIDDLKRYRWNSR